MDGEAVVGVAHYPRCEASSFAGGITMFYICDDIPEWFDHSKHPEGTLP